MVRAKARAFDGRSGVVGSRVDAYDATVVYAEGKGHELSCITCRHATGVLGAGKGLPREHRRRRHGQAARTAVLSAQLAPFFRHGEALWALFLSTPVLVAVEGMSDCGTRPHTARLSAGVDHAIGTTGGMFHTGLLLAARWRRLSEDPRGDPEEILAPRQMRLPLVTPLKAGRLRWIPVLRSCNKHGQERFDQLHAGPVVLDAGGCAPRGQGLTLVHLSGST